MKKKKKKIKISKEKLKLTIVRKGGKKSEKLYTAVADDKA